jgi:hypothetical protein
VRLKDIESFKNRGKITIWKVGINKEVFSNSHNSNVLDNGN